MTNIKIFSSFFKVLAPKIKCTLLIFSFLLSIFLQLKLSQPNASSFLKNFDYVYGEITSTKDFEQRETGYYSSRGYGELTLPAPDTAISGIYFPFHHPLVGEYCINVFFNTKDGDNIIRDVNLDKKSNGTSFYYLTIPTAIYDSITLQFISPLFSSDDTEPIALYCIGQESLEHIEGQSIKIRNEKRDYMELGLDDVAALFIESVLFFPEPWNETSLYLSRIDFISTLFLCVSLFYFCVFLYYKREHWMSFTPYIILFTKLFSIFVKSKSYGDDLLMFRFVKDNYDLLEYLRIRYEVWSSRLVIESFIYYLVHNYVLWAFLTALLCLLLCYSFTVILNLKDPIYHCFVVLLFLTYPISYIVEVGPIATITNYVWVFSFQVYSFLYAKKYLFQENISILLKITTLLASIYAANQEQSAALMFGFYMVFFAYLLSKKWRILPLLGHFSIVLFSLAFHLLSPGNHARSVIVYYYDFAAASILQKLEMGYTSTLLYMTISAPYFLLTLSLLIILLAYKNKNYLCGFCGVYVGFILLARTQFSDFTAKVFPALSQLELHFTETGTNPSFSNFSSVILILFLSSFLLAILYGVYGSIKNKTLSQFSIIVLFAGLCSHIILGFSPSFPNYGARTFYFLHFSFFFCCLVLFQELYKKIDKLPIRLSDVVKLNSKIGGTQHEKI